MGTQYDDEYDDKKGRVEGRKLAGRRPGKRKVDPFLADKTLLLDYRDAQLLSRFITERGKIVPRRVTGLCSKNQRKLKNAIRRARHLGILPSGGHRVPLNSL